MKDISAFSILLVISLGWNSYIDASDVRIAANMLAAVLSLGVDGIIAAIREGREP